MLTRARLPPDRRARRAQGLRRPGYVVVQAPEHVIENLKLSEKAARDGKKVTKRKPPEHNFVNWDLNTFKRLMDAQPEQLVSRFQVPHGMLLNVLSRRSDGCAAMRRPAPRLPRARGGQGGPTGSERGSSSAPLVSRQHRRVRPDRRGRRQAAGQRRSAGRLLDGPGAFAVPGGDDPAARSRVARRTALDLLTLVESILENPELILRRQLDRIKDRAVAQMKADGLDYEQRMEELEKLEYPKPLADFVYQTFNHVRRSPPVGRRGEHPAEVHRARDVRDLPVVRGVRARLRPAARGRPAAAAPEQRLQGARTDGARTA